MPAGLGYSPNMLSGTGQSGGLLGGLGLGGAGGWLRDNRGLLLSMGAGFSGPGYFSDGMSRAFAGAASGYAMDEEIRRERMKREQEARDRAETMQWLEGQGLPGIPSALGETAASAVLTNRLNPPDLPASIREWQYAQENPDFAAHLNPVDQPDLPAGWGWRDPADPYAGVERLEGFEPDPPAPPSSVREFEYAQENPAFAEFLSRSRKPTSLQERIGYFTDVLGMDYATAVQHALGTQRLTTDPYTQGSQIVDMTTGQGRPVTSAPPGASAMPPPPSLPAPSGSPAASGRSPTLYDSAGEAAGLWNTIEEGIAGPLGQLGMGDMADAETVEARNRFAMAENEFIRAMALSPRFPVAEQERIRGMLASINWAASEQTVQLQLKVLDQTLRRNLQQQTQLRDMPGLPIDHRKEAAANVEAIEDFLEVIGVPDESGEGWKDYGSGVRARPLN